MIGIVVDSSSQLPASLAERYGIATVPMVVEVDGVSFREGVDLDADTFYGAWEQGHPPEVSTSQPSPGEVAEAYRRVIEAGASEILSIHVTESMSGTMNSARLAARQVDVPVRVVDSRTASFGISCCAWSAAEAIAAGAELDEASHVAASRAASLRTSFVVGVPQLTDRSGRATGLDLGAAARTGLPVLAMTGPDLELLGTVAGVDAAVERMVADTLSWPDRSPTPIIDGLRVAVGTSDEGSRSISAALVERLTEHPAVVDLLEYRIGPSVGAHTGPGTAGLFCF